MIRQRKSGWRWAALGRWPLFLPVAIQSFDKKWKIAKAGFGFAAADRVIANPFFADRFFTDRFLAVFGVFMAIRWDKFTVKSQEAVQNASQLAAENGNPEI